MAMHPAFALEDLQRLKPFLQVVRSGSFAAAAAALRITPPAVSKSIARLEEELGVRLFNRTTRRVELTPAGRTFFEHVNRALAEIEQGVTMVRKETHVPEGVVRVWVTATFGRYGLMPVIALFHGRHPQVQLEVTFEDSSPDESYDLCIRQGRPTGKSGKSWLLCEYPVVLVASPAYLERRGAPAQPSDLDRHACIDVITPSVTGWLLIRAATGSSLAGQNPERFSHTPRGPLVVKGQRDASLMAALYGAGIVPTAALVAAPYIQSGRLVRVLPAYRLHNTVARSDTIWLQAPQRRHLPAKVQVLIDFLYERFGSTSLRKS